MHLSYEFRGYYTLAITAASTESYQATATPILDGPQASDSCGSFAYNQDGELTTGFASLECWNK
ncbi:MAG: hypothetical protein HOM11_10815 [Methylococcales bacterium]|nr:hypothetical protein [Methylococcales bacterium]MBT7444818.1 hypothetical protein [Methylococcales bacterium]